MTEVLVLIDAPDGKVTKPSLELLTIAAGAITAFWMLVP